jgi:hypothetical protein
MHFISKKLSQILKLGAFMHLINKFCIGSVALLLLLCKTAYAEDAPRPEKGFMDGFRLGGYTSAGITIPRESETTAAINEISMILTWEGESRFKFFSELELENPISWDDDNKFNTKQSYIDLERFYLDYNLSDKINLRGGRFLTPTGRWNQLHASPLVWTSSRPVATSRLFPTAANGMMAFGAIPLDNSAIEYSIFVETLKDIDEDDDDLKFRNTKGARIAFGQQANIGVNIMSFDERNVFNTRYHMLGLDFITNHRGIEFLGEAFQRWDAHNNTSGYGAYLQTAVPLPVGQNWFGIIRLETFHRPDEGHQQRWLIGTTWRMKPTQLLKLELTGGSDDQPESPRGFLASFAVLF